MHKRYQICKDLEMPDSVLLWSGLKYFESGLEKQPTENTFLIPTKAVFMNENWKFHKPYQRTVFDSFPQAHALKRL